MKKTILSIMLCLTALYSFSQNPSYTLSVSKDYLTKSRHQKTAAWIFLGGGAVVTALGFAVAQSNDINDALGGSSKNNAASTVLAVTGIASMAASIPFFISAAHNKHKAASLSLSLQKIPEPFPGNQFFVRRQPVILLKISL